MTRIWWLAAILCATASCDAHTSSYRITTPVPADPEGFSNALFQSTSVKLEPGHRVELVKNGAIFDRLEQELARAQQSIDIVLFIWRPGEPSMRMVKVITERARAGVACRIIFDAVASTDFERIVKPELLDAGCDVRAFRPLSKEVTVQRNHRKIVVIDGKRGITGGFGFSNEWLGEGLRSGEWRDTAVIVDGPAVNEMQQAFAANWQEVGEPLLPKREFAAQPVEGTTLAGFVTSTGNDHLTRAERLTQLIIASATKRIWIANPYFVPSDGLINLLIEKRKQGVDVRVMAESDETDMPSVLKEQRATYKRLLAGGVRIWEYQPALIHAKTMLVDDHLCVVGSINLDHLSQTEMEEGSLVMSDPRVAAELEQHWEADVPHAREIEPRTKVASTEGQ